MIVPKTSNILDFSRQSRRCNLRQRGLLITELIIAMGIIALALIPMSFIFFQEMKMCRAYYYDAVAMEIVDGEMEILAAGEWQAFDDGEHVYHTTSAAATNLPPGQLVLTRTKQLVRLEWRPAQKGKGRGVQREWRIR